jgi:diguanylate cyclase (GGDEF)-like protein
MSAESAARARLQSGARAGLAGLAAAMLVLGLAWLVATAGGPSPADADHAVEHAREYAAGLAIRLRLADQALRVTARDAGERGSADAAWAGTGSRYFESIAYASGGVGAQPSRGSTPTIPPLGRAALEHLARGDSVLVPASGTTHLLMLRRLVRSGSADQLVVAVIAPAFLWGGLAGTPEAIDVCVRDNHDVVMFCSASRFQAASRTLSKNALDGASGNLAWRFDNTQWQAGYARLDLPLSAASGTWTVIAGLAAAPAPPAAGMHPPAGYALLAALLAGLLAAIAAWRLPRPRPPDSTVDASAVAVDAPGNPEARLNASLERQRRALNGMAEIDRAILSGADTASLMALAATHMLDCSAEVVVLCAVVDHEISSRMAVVVGQAGKGAPQLVEQITPADSLLKLLDAQPEGCWSDQPGDFPFLGPLTERGARCALLLPLYQDARPAGVIALGLPARAALGAEAAAFARALAVRLGVALTTAARARALYAHTHFDTTTGLPNRRYLREHLGPQIARTRRDGQRLALLFIDLDEFRKVNAAAGHERGDLVLAEAAGRLREGLREEDILARFGGDEFVVVLPRIADGLDARRVADKLLGTLARSFALAGAEFQLGASIGISVFPDDAQTVDEMLRHADFAMFRAKAAGRGQYAFFDEDVNRQAGDRTRLEQELWRATENREFVVFYQPQIDLKSGRITGAEALVRWMHPERGLVAPGEFIALAEQSSLILKIGDQVLRAACAQYREWEHAGVAPAHISVNVTSVELRRPDFADRIEATLREFELRPFCLELEITESSLLENSAGVIDQLERLRKRGIRIAFDDFGTGYSSLGYLKRLPVDVLKIDQSFVRDMGADPDSASIARAIIDLAHHLGKSVIAEGIETELQRTLLASLGCEVGQGYLWSRPVPAGQFERLYRGSPAARPRPAPSQLLPACHRRDGSRGVRIAASL